VSEARVVDALARLEEHHKLHLPLRRGDLLGRLMLRLLWRRHLKWQMETNLATRDAINAMHDSWGSDLEQAASRIGLVRSETMYHELATLHRNDQNLMAGLNQRLHSSIGRIRTELGDLRLRFTEKAEDSTALEARVKELERQVGDLTSAARDVRHRHVQFDLFMDELRAALPNRPDSAVSETVPDRNSFLELAVSALLDGPAENVRQSRGTYLSVVREAREKGATGPVLDMAPWRGEWWEVVHGAGLQYRSASPNELVRKHCSSLGCEVAAADPIDVLAAAKPRSLGAVTAFRYAERQDPAQLARFVDLASANLQPSGVLVIETAEPGAPDFHLDPFARRPVHPDLLRFLVDAAGFSRAKIDTTGHDGRYCLLAWR
jgi:hypothetical protein